MLDIMLCDSKLTPARPRLDLDLISGWADHRGDLQRFCQRKANAPRSPQLDGGTYENATSKEQFMAYLHERFPMKQDILYQTQFPLTKVTGDTAFTLPKLPRLMA